ALIVVGDTPVPSVLSVCPDAILPYRPETTVDVAPASLAALLAQIPEDATDVPALGGEVGQGRAVASARALGARLARARARATSGDRAVAADASYGSGGVTVIGVDPTVGWIAESKATVALWRNLIPARSSGAAGRSAQSQIS